MFVQDGERALFVLNDLKDIGVKLSLDDFGTGYSSLGYLRRFPVDSVKIDREFVANLGHDPASHTIVTAVIQLAHGLGMTVVCEGVETAEQHQTLTAWALTPASVSTSPGPCPTRASTNSINTAPTQADQVSRGWPTSARLYEIRSLPIRNVSK